MTDKYVFVLLKLNNPRSRLQTTVKRCHGKFIRQDSFSFNGTEYQLFVFHQDPQKSLDEELLNLRKSIGKDADVLQWKDDFEYYAFVGLAPRQNLNYHQINGNFMVLHAESMSREVSDLFGFNIVMCDPLVGVPKESMKRLFADKIIFEFESPRQPLQSVDQFVTPQCHKKMPGAPKKRKQRNFNRETPLTKIKKRLSFGKNSDIYIIKNINSKNHGGIAETQFDENNIDNGKNAVKDDNSISFENIEQDVDSVDSNGIEIDNINNDDSEDSKESVSENQKKKCKIQSSEDLHEKKENGTSTFAATTIWQMLKSSLGYDPSETFKKN